MRVIVFLIAVFIFPSCKPHREPGSELQSVQATYESAEFSRKLIETTIELSIQAYEDDRGALRNEILPNIEFVSDKTFRTEIFRFKDVGGIFANSSYFMIRRANQKPIPANMVIISFRGTDNLGNIMTDLNVTSTLFYRGYVHSGFFNAYYAPSSPQQGDFSPAARVKKFIETFIREKDVGLPVKNYVVFTGHSLGGALALISAMDNCNPANPYKRKVGYQCLAYTYAAPRTFEIGNQQFFNSFMRYEMPEDDVSRMTDAKSGYTHFNFQVKGDPVPSGGFASYKHSGNIYRISERADQGREMFSFSKHSVSNTYKVAILDFMYNKESKYKIQLMKYEQLD